MFGWETLRTLLLSHAETTRFDHIDNHPTLLDGAYSSALLTSPSYHLIRPTGEMRTRRPRGLKWLLRGDRPLV